MDTTIHRLIPSTADPVPPPPNPKPGIDCRELSPEELATYCKENRKELFQIFRYYYKEMNYRYCHIYKPYLDQYLSEYKEKRGRNIKEYELRRIKEYLTGAMEYLRKIDTLPYQECVMYRKMRDLSLEQIEKEKEELERIHIWFKERYREIF